MIRHRVNQLSASGHAQSSRNMRFLHAPMGSGAYRKVIFAQVGLESFRVVVQSANQFTRCMMEHLCKASW